MRRLLVALTAVAVLIPGAAAIESAAPSMADAVPMLEPAPSVEAHGNVSSLRWVRRAWRVKDGKVVSTYCWWPTRHNRRMTVARNTNICHKAFAAGSSKTYLRFNWASDPRMQADTCHKHGVRTRYVNSGKVTYGPWRTIWSYC